MNSTQRTDIHRPSAINPAEYNFVAFNYIKADTGDGVQNEIAAYNFMKAQRRVVELHMERTGGTWSNHEHGGTCNVCGAWAKYTATFHHVPTNTYIKTGLDCADKMGMGYGDANLFRRQVKEAREAVAGKRKAQAVLAENGMTAAWDLYVNAGEPGTGLIYKYEEMTICDMVGKLVTYGSLSEKQFAFMGRLFAQIESRNAVQAKRDAETAAAKEIPNFDGRVEIEGVVLSYKYDSENAFPGYRMLVQHADGWKVYGTAPDGVEKGQTIRFNASVIVSRDDKKFGYFKRPTKLVVVQEAASEMVAA